PYQPRSGRDAEKLQSDDDLWPCRPRRGAPIDRFQKHGQLRHGQRDNPLLGLRPDETTTIQLLRVQAHALTIPEQNLHQVTSTTAKNVERAAEWICGAPHNPTYVSGVIMWRRRVAAGD